MYTEKTKVVFRKWNKDIDPKEGIIVIFLEDIHPKQAIISIFPEKIPPGDMPICNWDAWERYERGERGEINFWFGPCVPEVVIKGSKPATEIEYREDKNYLENHYGYNLKVLKRIPRTAKKVRSKIIAQL